MKPLDGLLLRGRQLLWRSAEQRLPQVRKVSLGDWAQHLLVLFLLAAAATGATAQPLQSTKVPFVSDTLNTTITVAPADPVGDMSLTWEATPACTVIPTVYNSGPDLRGRRWGQEAGHACAFKDPASNEPVFTWETAPRCLTEPSLFVAVADDKGRLWGYQFGRKCAFKAADSDRPLYDFLTAPPCVSPVEPVTSEPDAQGRLWGWEQGQECAYKSGDNTPLQLPEAALAGAADASNPPADSAAAVAAEAEGDVMVARGAVPTSASLTWRASTRCVAPPSKFTATMDGRGRLWGWESNSSCAFKDAQGLPVYDWDTAPRCLEDASEGNSRPDPQGRLWGWAAGSSCAFKDLANEPLRTWAMAPRCPAVPQMATAVPDSLGRLWGWAANGTASCAFKTAEGQALTFVAPLQSTSTPADADAAAAPSPALATNAAATDGAVARPPGGGPARRHVLGAEVLWVPVESNTDPSSTNAATAPSDVVPQQQADGEGPERQLQPLTEAQELLLQWVVPQVQITNAAALQQAAHTAALQQAAMGLDPNAAEEEARSSTASSLAAAMVADAQPAPAVPTDDNLGGSSSSSPDVAGSGLGAAAAPGEEVAPGNPHTTYAGGGPALPADTPAPPPAVAPPLADAAPTPTPPGGQRRLRGLLHVPSSLSAALKQMLTSATSTAAAAHPVPPRWGSGRAPHAAARRLHHTHARRLGQSPRAAARDAGDASHWQGRDWWWSFHPGHLPSHERAHTGGQQPRPEAQQPQLKGTQADAHAHGPGGRRLLDALSGFPSCGTWPAPLSAVQDGAGRYWSNENGRSCIYRGSDGLPASQWEVVPACTGSPGAGSADSNDRVWGWESGRTCAFKDGQGRLRTGQEAAPQPTPAAAAAAAGTDDAWSRAAACRGVEAIRGAVSDAGGRLWGWEDGRSCAVRDAPAATATAPAANKAAAVDPNDRWGNTPACAAARTDGNAKQDAQGRYWGWENGQSCAFKTDAPQQQAVTSLSVTPAAAAAATATSTSTSASTASSASAGMPSSFATGDVRTGPACSVGPTMDNSQPDDVGFLWGWEQGRACVFRNSDGKPIYYSALINGDWSAQPGYVPKPSGTPGWFDAPRCSKPPTWEAKPDSEGRLWGYENGQGCVFRDARGYPIFYSDLQNGNVAEYYNQGSKWDNAPSCPSQPTWSNARADNYGRLWGWDGGAASSCAYKDRDGNAVYPARVF